MEEGAEGVGKGTRQGVSFFYGYGIVLYRAVLNYDDDSCADRKGDRKLYKHD